MQAASQNGHVDVLKLLLKHNVDLEAEVLINKLIPPLSFICILIVNASCKKSLSHYVGVLLYSGQRRRPGSAPRSLW